MAKHNVVVDGPAEDPVGLTAVADWTVDGNLAYLMGQLLYQG